MASEWSYKKIGEVAKVKGGKRMPAGTSLTQEKTAHPYLRIVDFRSGGIDSSSLLYVPDDVFPIISRYTISTSDIYISIVGTIGIIGQIPISLDGANLTENAAKITEIDTQAVAPTYLRYFLSSNEGQSEIRSQTVGSTQPKLALYRIEEIKFPLPPLKIQHAIAEILGALDDRIDNLRQTNATLEAIAAALFKSWFVDFDGVAQEDMQESELGLIPKGWRIGSAYDIANVRYGAPFASSKFNTAGNGLPLVRIRDLRNESPGVWTPEVHPKGYLIQPGDIIVGMDGEFRAYLWGGESAWMNQRVCAFHPKKPHCAAFVHNAIAPHLAQVEATEVATTVIHLGKGDIDEFRFVVPSDEVASNFAASCQPLYDRIVTNKQQAATLATIRDTLLPRLISGKLRIGDTARMVEQAA